MAFTKRNLDPGASGKGAPNQASYFTAADNTATGEGSNYFDAAAGSLNNAALAGTILCVWSDASILYGYTSTASTVVLDTGNKTTVN